jgi:DNA-binding transcriptional ArsR family regulator
MSPLNENDRKELTIRNSIFDALSDEEWHRITELRSTINEKRLTLKNTTKLSSRTLDKHLDKMVETQLIEKKKDVIKGKYAVLYKATPEVIEYVRSNILRKGFSDNLDGMLEETKNPLVILDMIHLWSQENFLLILRQIKNKKIDNDNLHFIEEAYLWYDYEFFTMKLIAATAKIIDEIDIDRIATSLIKEQAAFLSLRMSKSGKLKDKDNSQ